jgi:hypothetical protein
VLERGLGDGSCDVIVVTVMVKTTSSGGKCKDFCMHMVVVGDGGGLMTQKTNEDNEDARRRGGEK